MKARLVFILITAVLAFTSTYAWGQCWQSQPNNCENPEVFVSTLYKWEANYISLQALCPKCHMQKSKVQNFYGNTHYTCCLKEGEQSPEKILPYDVSHRCPSISAG